MRAKYMIRTCESCDDVFVDHVIIDVSDDPTYPENCDEAVKALGYDPFEHCGNACGFAYQAYFIGYAGPETVVPFALIEQLVAVVNVNQQVSISRDARCIAVIGQLLKSLGYVNRDSDYKYSVTDALKGLRQ